MANFKTTEISFTSRASVKIGESYFTFESQITKQCPEEYTDEEYVEAKNKLWDEVNEEVDNQIAELKNYLRNKK